MARPGLQANRAAIAGALAPSSLLALFLLAAGVLPGCGDDSPGAQKRTGGGTRAVSPEAGLTAAALRVRNDQGRKLFLAECSGCHGERARGDGPAAQTIDPKPRDLVKDRFRYRTSPSGEPPRRDDLLETLRRGMPGSAMPSFRFLRDEEQGLLVDYVRTLAGFAGQPDADPVPLPPEKPAEPKSIAHGREVYAAMQCFKCHGDEGHGDGTSAPTLKDERERPIKVRDLAKGVFRRGENASEIFRTFKAGLDGTPMPSYASALKDDDGWDLARYILSMKAPAAAPPADRVAYGRQVVEEKQCFACHVIEGRGATVGPSLDVSSKKLRFAWVREFLAKPRVFGKLYPFTPYRMPDLGLKGPEIDAVLALFSSMSGRAADDPAEPAPAASAADIAKGQLFYVLRCAECHNLGNVIPTPEAKRQGPDLINASRRLRYGWISDWVKNPQNVYPGTSMVNSNLSPEEVDIVRSFLWSTSESTLTKGP